VEVSSPPMASIPSRCPPVRSNPNRTSPTTDEGYCVSLTRRGSQSSAFSPTLLSGGEGGRRTDEGAFDVAPRLPKPQAHSGMRGSFEHRDVLFCNAPLIRLRHLLPPKSTGGEGARLERVAIVSVRNMASSGLSCISHALVKLPHASNRG